MSFRRDFELLESIDELNLHLTDAENEPTNCGEELNKSEEQIQSRKLVLESDLTRVEASLSAAEQERQGDFKREYERLVAPKPTTQWRNSTANAARAARRA